MARAARAETKRIHFNRENIAALEAPPTGRQYVYDDTVPSLAVCLSSTGNRTFYCIRKIRGRPERIRLGTVAELGVERARNLAREIVGSCATGANPAEERRVRRRTPTLDDAFAYWLESHAKLHRKDWATCEKRYARQIAPALGHRRLSDIKPTDVAAWHGKYGVERGKIEANRLAELVRAVVNKASGIGYTGANPFDGFKRFRETPRDRFIADDEMPRFRAALADAPQDVQDAIWLLLLTASRKSALLAMRWQDVDLDAGVWVIPAHTIKGGRTIAIPLVAQAVAILRRRHAATTSEWVFPSATAKRGYVFNIHTAWCKVLAEAGIVGLTLHDLRRSCASAMVQSGASFPTVARLLGHRSQAATLIYARLDLATVRAATEKAAAKMLGTEGGE